MMAQEKERVSMNELTMREKLLLLGILTLTYERKAKMIEDKNIGSYIEYLKKDLSEIESINRKLSLDMRFPETSESA